MKLSLFERIARKRHVDVSVENIDTTNKMDGDMERGLQLQNTLGESDLWEEGSFESGGEDSSEDESKQDNPFAPREGKTLTWRSINMILVSKTLRESSFHPPTGTLTIISYLT